MSEAEFDYDELEKRIKDLAKERSVNISDEQIKVFFDAEFSYMNELGLIVES
ncbi:hypothetical protein JR311_19865 (plasmid) [Bacillus velezensis]|uniref:hypothetical protein n=1 Tax=Bacillus velezensis TaxID=492670 RepID=UPI000B05B6A4|nr:hypothetical protein [Bacillus velezensis]QRV11465.1 hypothetical protein JR311_19865 [Bacillus velezensis]URJ76453.1 hypothetical protein MF619_004029 [Bacillus velezensis]URJ80409.1 hypothetical protein MF621_003991 [Bacillus velezensis]